MPVKNGAEFLEKTLQSLISQEYKNLEIIISDNNSSDETASICKKYLANYEYIKYQRSQVDLPAIANFNAVLDKAAGKYFMWAAHDDLWEANCISCLVNLLENNPDSPLASCSIYGIDRDDAITWDCPWTFELQSKNKILRIVKYVTQDDHHRKPVLVYGLMRTEILRRAGGFKQRGRYPEGVALHVVLSVLPYGNIALTRDAAFYKRKTGRKYHTESKHRNIDEKGFLLKRKISALGNLCSYVNNHPFVKYLDGYREVVKASGGLNVADKILLMIFLYVWQGWLSVSLFLKEFNLSLRSKAARLVGR